MKKLKWFPIVGLLPLLLPVLVVTVLLGAIGSGSANSETKLKYTITGQLEIPTLIIYLSIVTESLLSNWMDFLILWV